MATKKTKILIGAIGVLVLLVSIVSSEAIVRQLGVSGQCDTSLVGCRPIPITSSVCVNPSTCARITASDPTNSNIFYGTDNLNCRKSVNTGVTWDNCTTNPSTVSLLHYAVNMDGEILVAGNGVGGTTFIIQRSIDGGISWSNVFSTATVDADNATVFTQRIACAKSTLICIAAYRSAGAQLIGLSSIDGGASWSSTTLGASFGTIVGVTISDDGTIGGAGIRSGDGVSNFKGGTWNGTTWALGVLWPNTAGALCVNTLIYNAALGVFCKEVASGSYTIRDSQGIVQKTITLPNGFTGVPNSYTGYMVNISIGVDSPLIVLGADNRVGSSMWVSIDGTAFFQTLLLSDVGSGIGFQGSAYLANGCAYFSSNQTANPTGILLKAC